MHTQKNRNRSLIDSLTSCFVLFLSLNLCHISKYWDKDSHIILNFQIFIEKTARISEGISTKTKFS